MKTIYTLLFAFMLFSCIPISAQHMYGGGTGYMFPDTLNQITVTGKVKADSTGGMAFYYIDTNNDGNEDYILNFGPLWYSPADTVSRPVDGSTITVAGRLTNMQAFQTPMIIVFTVNGKLWRDSFDPMWNDFGNNTHMMGQHENNCNGYAYGYNTGKPQTVTLTGTALVDTTFFMNMYYLDTDNNGTPNYLLNLGPWWYQPNNGTQRPKTGELITIKAGLMQAGKMPVLIVYEINGSTWRDSTLIGKYFGGMWINKNQSNDTIMNPFDNDDFMKAGSGWQMGMGGMMSDSLFGRMLELNPYNIPNGGTENIFKGYEFGMFNPNGQNGMMQNGNCGGMMNFNSNANFQFHFNNDMLAAYGLSKNNIQVKYWDNQSNKWTAVTNASVNLSNNTVSFSTNNVSSYFILTADKLTDVKSVNEIPTGYVLEQNYPNPFNPTTTINYYLPTNDYVTLQIFNMLGQKVATLFNGNLTQGNHSILFSAENFHLSSGIYFYQLKTPNFTATKKLVLLQ